ncbi:YfjP family GTPase, partial [Escherichia coli]|uniref:YfjP family GTPase n=1 Tax=Escherichia coli TaxID=562 RepID=UPI00202CD1DC
MNPSDAIEAIEKPLSSLPYSLSRHILEHLRKLTSHEPVPGIMGKSGAGKSSLCNALFQGEVTPVSDVHAGPREVQRFRLNGHGHSMVITDLPGVGESRDRDAEYEALYRDILPELNLVLWLIKADDRALSVDEYFWRHILHRGHQRILFVVMQADKTEPCCVFRSIRSRIGIEVRSAIRIHSINRELNFFYRFLTRFFAAFH